MAYKNLVITPTKYKSQNTQKLSQFYRGFSTLDDATNSTKLYDFELIKQDILNQFNTRKGERVMNPTFGTIIWDLLFEPLTSTTKQQLADDINRILTSDPRATPTKIDIVDAEHGFLIEITLVLNGTDVSQNMQLSFDRNAGLAR